MESPVTFPVHGTQVVGILHTPDANTAKSPAVLMLHGFTATKTESHRIFVKTARALAKTGFVALRFDFRGWGDSGGESEESSISSMVEDVKAGTDFLLAHPNVDPSRLGYLGFSTGGAAAALAAGHDDRVRTVALWNAVADGGPIVQNLITVQRATAMATKGVVDYNGNRISRRFIMEFMTMKPVAALAKRPVPTLLIQAGKDPSVPAGQVDIYEQALAGKGVRCAKSILADADHVFSTSAWEQRVIEETVKWFEGLLAEKAGA